MVPEWRSPEGVPLIRACLIGSAVVFALIVIPVVHWITALPSPFIGGYLAGTRAREIPNAALIIGPVMALMLTVPILLIFVIVAALFDFGIQFVLVGGLIYALYAAALGTLGAAVGSRPERS